MATPSKNPISSRSQPSENRNPNLQSPPPPPKSGRSTPLKSAQSKKSAAKTAVPATSKALAPPPPQRKFIVAKKSSRRAADNGFDFDKCRREALETLRASHEEFFRKAPAIGAAPVVAESSFGKEEKRERNAAVDCESPCSRIEELEGSAKVRKMRSLLSEEAMSSVPEPGSGMVKHLVKAFEGTLTISDEKETKEVEELSESKKVKVWKPVIQNWGSEISGDSVFSSAEFLRSEAFGRDSRLYRSLDSDDDRVSWGRNSGGGGRRSRRNSSESLKRSWNEKLKVTSQHPFKLKTELRGRIKQEQFLKKVNAMLIEEEKKRIPIAQGLPWTTDEPECLVKPTVKQSTEPIDVVLHSDVRAVERGEFDNYVAERLSFAEQLRLERERQKKLEKEEEVRRIRKELVPKAQPMPYFDRPFLPKKSEKPRTIPKEPRFHIRPKKTSCSSTSLLR